MIEFSFIRYLKCSLQRSLPAAAEECSQYDVTDLDKLRNCSTISPIFLIAEDLRISIARESCLLFVSQTRTRDYRANTSPLQPKSTLAS
jgi:hypothetical protein